MGGKGDGQAVIVQYADAEALSRWLSPFAGKALTGGGLQAVMVFGGGKAAVCGGTVGAEAPWGGADFVLPALALSGPLLSARSDVSFDVGDGGVTARAGGFKARFTLISPELVPEWPKAPGKGAWIQLPPDAWAAALTVAFAAGAARPGCAGVYVKGGVAYATNGVRAARAAVKGAPDGFIPSRLLDAASRASGGPPDAAAFEGDRVWLRFGDRTCWSLLPVEEFPAQIISVLAKYSKEAGKGYAVRYAPADAVAAVARVKEFSDSASGVAVRAEPGKGMVVFSAKGPRGEAEEFIPAEVSAAVDVDADGVKLEEMIGITEALAVASDGSCVIFRKPGFEAILMCLAR